MLDFLRRGRIENAVLSWLVRGRLRRCIVCLWRRQTGPLLCSHHHTLHQWRHLKSSLQGGS